MTTLLILSGGAAEGLVECTAPTFREQTGFTVEGRFGAVGEMANRIRAGEVVDVVILTRNLISELAALGLVSTTSLQDIGAVPTSLAVKKDEVAPRVATAHELRTALLAAPALFTPDIETSTAGRHVGWVLNELGIWQDMQNRMRIFPNGAKAMAGLAASDLTGSIGCTQATEILNTVGVSRIADLPQGLSLSTVYTAAVAVGSRHEDPANQLIDLLSSSPERTRLGFLS